jgi:hypothetical protein
MLHTKPISSISRLFIMANFFGLGNSSKKKRIEFSPFVKIMTIKKQGNLCAKCNGPFSGKEMPEFYYKNFVNPDSSEENCQALHVKCHDEIAKSVASKTIVKKEYPKVPSFTDNTFYKLDYKDLV